jgi:hypothetical protein
MTTGTDVGETIICNGEYAVVTAVVTHAPGTHPDSPIDNTLPAREWVTARGSRWSGLRTDNTAFCEPA